MMVMEYRCLNGWIILNTFVVAVAVVVVVVTDVKQKINCLMDDFFMHGCCFAIVADALCKGSRTH